MYSTFTIGKRKVNLLSLIWVHHSFTIYNNTVALKLSTIIRKTFRRGSTHNIMGMSKGKSTMKKKAMIFVTLH